MLLDILYFEIVFLFSPHYEMLIMAGKKCLLLKVASVSISWNEQIKTFFTWVS